MNSQEPLIHPSNFYLDLLTILEEFQIHSEQLEFCEDTGKRAEELGWDDTRSFTGKIGCDAGRVPRILLQDPISLHQATITLRSSSFTQSERDHLGPSHDRGRLFTIHLLLHEIAHWEVGDLSLENPGPDGDESTSTKSSEEGWVARRAKEIRADEWAIQAMQRLAFLPPNLTESLEES